MLETTNKKADSDVIIDIKDVSVMFNLSKNKEDSFKDYIINLVQGKLHYSEFWALRDINFQVRRGESLALIGRNGSGKSTLLKTVAGIIKPARGRVTVTGSIAPLIELNGGFDKSLSARDNIFLAGAMHGHTKKYMQRHFDEIVEFAEIERFLDFPLKKFSSGMMSRLGFAVATCVNPDILIADEVLSVGDTRFRAKCSERIAEMVNRGVTILFVSHSSARVKKICQNAIWLEKGKIVEAGASVEVCNHYTEFMKNLPDPSSSRKAIGPHAIDELDD